jgi:hypothetical protein
MGTVQMNTKLSAVFAAVFCLTAVGQATATVNQAGNLLWTADLPGLATDASVTPVVFASAMKSVKSPFSWSYSGATFSGDSSQLYGVFTGPWYGAFQPGPGFAATSNYLFSWEGGSITMTTPAPEAYLGFLMPGYAAFNVTLYNGGNA